MKLKIFKSTSKNGKAYWSVSAANYKNKEDKGTYFISFGKDCVEPLPMVATTQGGKNYQYADIDVVEMKLNWFNGSPSLFISKFTQGDAPKDTSKAKPNNEVVIEEDELPFY